MESLWSMSTTVRESDRVLGFLKVAELLEGEVWDKENQGKFQMLLVQKRQYLNNIANAQTFNKLNEEQSNWLINQETEMPYEMAESIILSKNYVGGPDMRGRNSMAPLRKLGLVYLDDENRIVISDVGKKFINNEISYEEFFRDSLLKLQYPNPLDDSFKNWNTKPFISIMHLIREVNKRCENMGMKEKGLSKDEFGIFALSLMDYREIEKYADLVIEYRIKHNSLSSYDEKEEYRKKYISEFLKDFNNPEQNSREYTDNMTRYLRQTKFISLRGKYSHTYIDLESRRLTEINSILDNDNAQPKEFNTESEWIEYFTTYDTYHLPYETVDNLFYILKNIEEENMIIAEESNVTYNSYYEGVSDKNKLKVFIEKAREERTRLQNIQLKTEYYSIDKIDETIMFLKAIQNKDKDNILTNRPSLEMEKWMNIALNILNDAILIKPNTLVGDDNEPIHTAPGGVADIECYYESFNAICEVTTLTSRDQWINEGQPVMRHLRNFEDESNKNNNFCLFVAPRLHQDTINTFWISVKHNYEGEKQNIVPITINQLIKILEAIKVLHSRNERLNHQEIKTFLESASNVNGINSSLEWVQHINQTIEEWTEYIKS